MNGATMPTDTQALEARLEPLSLARLDEVLAIEGQAHPHPWSRRQFTDALASGYRIDLLLGGDQVLGFFVAMRGVEEAHLLNLTVAPAFQRQGWGQILLDALALWARGEGLRWLWLEVRVGNDRARAVYQANGFRQVGLRKRYYPAAGGTREDALVMSRAL